MINLESSSEQGKERRLYVAVNWGVGAIALSTTLWQIARLLLWNPQVLIMVTIIHLLILGVLNVWKPATGNFFLFFCMGIGVALIISFV